ncbi:MAG: GNAT family N-acetyltransferase [Actinobacteria bacterium]|jgi:RimJ/RimL family protein N-acetyltransferase|nr:GNAT family N-acetyltransferase [Actinomycetota bacterium]
MDPDLRPPTIRLRPVREDDLETLFAVQADPAWADMVGLPGRDHADFLAHKARILADPANLSRVIEADGAVVGSIATFPMGDSREVGYSVARSHWGRGIATEALRLMLIEDPTRPLEAGTAAGNAASRRVLEKLGFRVSHVDESDGFVIHVLD